MAMVGTGTEGHCFEFRNSLSEQRGFRNHGAALVLSKVVASERRSTQELIMNQLENPAHFSANHPVALITGGSRGLGKSMALHLAARGVGVIFTYRERAEEAAQVVKEIEDEGGAAAALPLDLSDVSHFGAFAQKVERVLSERFQRTRFDYLVNNAGMGAHAPLIEATEEQFDALMTVHVKSTVFLTQKLLPLLVDGARILNVSSGLTRFTMPGYGLYAAMKGAVEVLTRYFAKELAGRKITVNTLAPGAIETDFGGGAVRDNPEINRRIAEATALGRVGQPDDIGRAASLLLSPESGWITGQRIEASGGQVL
jgi:NAD(P)-dependent dehydrogenase (short-subunit alcohol dehydrogenase family)